MPRMAWQQVRLGGTAILRCLLRALLQEHAAAALSNASAPHSHPPCCSLQARQRSVKDQLLRQVPVIGRDRLKATNPQLTASPNGFIVR